MDLWIVLLCVCWLVWAPSSWEFVEVWTPCSCAFCQRIQQTMMSTISCGCLFWHGSPPNRETLPAAYLRDLKSGCWRRELASPCFKKENKELVFSPGNPIINTSCLLLLGFFNSSRKAVGRYTYASHLVKCLSFVLQNVPRRFLFLCEIPDKTESWISKRSHWFLSDYDNFKLTTDTKSLTQNTWK